MRNTLRMCVVVAVMVYLAGCSQPMNRTQKGAGIGAATGALAGALIGQAAGGDTESTLIGAGVGAAVGAGTGAGIGYYMDQQEQAMRNALASVEGVKIDRDGNILYVTFRSDNQFDVGSFTLRAGAQQDVARLAAILTEYHKTTILVAGHTDSTGSEEYNLGLSERRAMAVRNILVASGVISTRITTVGFGESAPIADNSTEYGRQLNRRVALKITPI
ncbi:OmpA family protein [Desulfuromonas acetoxidans]|uniref:OmpA/MotB n=1 Tax=Desulfuromonas acetoxidans (strain DSM 684 / 11070) TaxID=281689 RepID=Q1K1F8_DESA6|nr:OmpA family protein [Desulfuromonas acetoxidans]EAT16430.1 OmpA/MotB [Desulfuromonas acetoxidans DSM 684]MBF0644376.1 OmpA family protein [Desulfuromonas acetoxidans]NVD23570.1 OmpA family protein [Desulfuromonas acetoxidans]NVE16045.1 OmpA family protein [Desulfuromonas acetoxidans]